MLFHSSHRCHHHLINIITTTPWHQFASFNYLLGFQTSEGNLNLAELLYCLGYLSSCCLAFCALLLSYSQVSGLIHLVFLHYTIHIESKYKLMSKMLHDQCLSFASVCIGKSLNWFLVLFVSQDFKRLWHEEGFGVVFNSVRIIGTCQSLWMVVTTLLVLPFQL